MSMPTCLCAAKLWQLSPGSRSHRQQRAGDKAVLAGSAWQSRNLPSSPAGLVLGTGECEAVPLGPWGLEGRAATGLTHAEHPGILSSAAQWLRMAFPGGCTSNTPLQDAPEKWINIYHSFLEIYNPHPHIKCSEKS